MQSLLRLLLAAGSVNAAWLKWTVDSSPTWQLPQETGSINEIDGTVGWTPKPTQAPGHRSQGDLVLELLKRDTFTTTNWTNSETCGWVSGVSCKLWQATKQGANKADLVLAYPWTCGDEFVCSTNSEHAVACVSGQYEPFFVSCFDFEASKAGSCDNLGSNTGCW